MIKTKSNLKISTFFLILFGLLFASLTLAGFGVAPSQFTNLNLGRGSEQEEKFILVRGDPQEDLKAVIVVKIPGAEDWVTIDKGSEFLLPKGQKNVPMMVKVKVPENAKPGKYHGGIQITALPIEPQKPGTVAINLGVQIDVNLGVSNKEISDLNVRSVKTDDARAGEDYKFWMEIENRGNFKDAPDKLTFDVYDSAKKSFVEKNEAKKVNEKIEPFKTKMIYAEVSNELSAGSYLLKYKIYKDDKTINEGEAPLSILPGEAKKGIVKFKAFGKNIELKTSVIIVSAIVLIIIALAVCLLVYKKRKKSGDTTPKV